MTTKLSSTSTVEQSRNIKPYGKLTVIMLAPTIVVGGITTWLKVLLKYSSGEKIGYHVIDTSKLYDPLGKKMTLRGAVLGSFHGTIRLFKLVKAVIKLKPQMVYLTCAPGIGFAVRDTAYLFLLHYMRVPSVAHLHGGNVKGFFGGSIFRRWIVRCALKTCRLVIVITRETEKAGIEILDRKKILYFPNMLDDEFVRSEKEKNIRLPTGQGDIRLLHVAWQSPEKGSIDLVDAMKHVSHSVKCDLVGKATPEYKVLIEKKIESLGVKDKIRLVGQKMGRDIEEAFENADIFVFPTHREGPEGFPMVVLEAMAYGLPIIANEVGNIREMIGYDTDEPAGMLLKHIDPIDPKELAESIDQLIDKPEVRSHMSIAGKKRLNNQYLASVCVPKLEDVLIAVSREGRGV